MDEFSLIKRFFDIEKPPEDVVCGIGDDAAIVDIPAGHPLLVTTDTLVAGVHFPEETAPDAIGHKALAVNLSDIAAMGGAPRWYTLSLTLPDSDEGWLAEFARGLFALSDKHAVTLIGGDTTRGPLSVTITLIGDGGEEPLARRSGARPGDVIAVTGKLGEAAMALRCLEQDNAACLTPELREALDRPVPRVPEGQLLGANVHAMIDISDGLAADLCHILAASDVGAEVDVSRLPVTHPMLQAGADLGMDEAACRQLAMTGGDDYELCATLPEQTYRELCQAWPPGWAGLTRIGNIIPGKGITLQNADGWPDDVVNGGYRHFT